MLPGEVIKESEIAQLLNISRTPVHEAVLMLKENFLVDVLPQSSSKVSLVDLEMMREGYFLRNVLEPTIIRQVAGTVSPDLLRRLRENLDKQTEIITHSDEVDEYFSLDDEFHGLIYEAANKSHIWTMVKNVCSDFDRVRHMDTILMSGDRKQFRDDHKTLYQYMMLGVGSQDDIEGFYDKHIGSYKKDFNKMLAKYPNYFAM
jgi:DNA-binding GntR family transcriptional regulator